MRGIEDDTTTKSINNKFITNLKENNEKIETIYINDIENKIYDEKKVEIKTIDDENNII